MFISGHIRCISVLPKQLCCWRQQSAFGPLQVTQQHCCLWCGRIVSCCDFSSPQLMRLHYSVWLLYCRSAIVLMTLETHAVTLPQVLTHVPTITHSCGVCTRQFMAVHMECAVSGVFHTLTVSSSSFPWDCDVPCSVAVSPVATSLQRWCITANSSGHGGTSRLIVSTRTSVGNPPFHSRWKCKLKREFILSSHPLLPPEGLWLVRLLGGHKKGRKT